jgi:hypothetical protein
MDLKVGKRRSNARLVSGREKNIRRSGRASARLAGMRPPREKADLRYAFPALQAMQIIFQAVHTLADGIRCAAGRREQQQCD